MPPKKAPVGYTYTKLNDLKEGFGNNVFGILVEVIKESVITTSGLLHSVYLIVDDSLPSNKLFRMNCFIHGDHLPKFCVGDIMRFHRVKVESWSRGFDGRVFNSTDVVSFSSDHTSGFKYTSLAQTITLTDKDKERISELREIAALRTIFGSSEVSSMNGTDTSTNEQPNILTQPSIIQADVETSSGKLFLNPAADLSLKRSLLPNPFHEHNQKKKESEAGPSRKRSNSGIEESESTVNIDKKQASSTEKKKKLKVCPLSQQRQNIEEEPSSSLPQPLSILDTDKLSSDAVSAQKETRGGLFRKQNSLEPNIPVEQTESHVHIDNNQELDTEELSSAAVLAQRDHTLMAHPNEPNKVQQSDDIPSSVEAESSSCPGIVCAEQNCVQTPVLIESDDIASEPYCDIDGEIPAADDRGNVFPRNPQFMNFKAQENKKAYIDANSLSNFKWPCFSSKVRIKEVKPDLQVLKTKGPKNLLSGVCKKCGTYSYYSKLLWKINKDTATKNALCPLCYKEGDTSRIYLEFRLQLTLEDAWGKLLKVLVTREDACTFLGCSQSQYQRSNECRLRTIELLSKALSSKSLFTICLTCVTTLTKKMVYVYGTELSKALKNVV